MINIITKAKELLILNNQEQLLTRLDALPGHRQEILAEQIIAIDFPALQHRQRLLEQRGKPDKRNFEPFTEFRKKGNKEHLKAGEAFISQGSVGCLVVAGGQSSRLGIEGPKGRFPISVIKNKSLFQLIAEKTVFAGKKAKRDLFLAIMTSPDNDLSTKDFFSTHDYFGLRPSQLFFFCQKQIPLLDGEGKLFLEAPDKIAEGPDGNGHVFKHFVESGVWNRWHDTGIRAVNFILIDNPLADPWDAELIGSLFQDKADVVIKSVIKENPDEKVGLIVKESGKVKIVEYTELLENEKKARDETGSLLFKCANIGLFAFTMDYIKTCSEIRLPYHLAFKAVKYLNANNQTVKSPDPVAWKFETFIFDLIPYAKKVQVLLYPKEECFAPLKNRTGPDSPETVKKALQALDRKTFENISGVTPPDTPFELSQEFYYPDGDFLKKWNCVPPPDEDYITS